MLANRCPEFGKTSAPQLARVCAQIWMLEAKAALVLARELLAKRYPITESEELLLRRMLDNPAR